MIDPHDLENYAPRYGVDLGFSDDPIVIVKTYVLEKFKTIYVQRETYGYGVPNNRLGHCCCRSSIAKTIWSLQYAEPRTINYLQSEGFNIQPAAKDRAPSRPV